MKTENSPANSVTLEENLKKALTELLILHLLSTREYFIGELTEGLKQKSGGVLKLVFPYSAVYRLQQDGYILSSEKRISSDGRRRQYYGITPKGLEYYRQLLDSYNHFIAGVNTLLDAQA